jgi:hypothetical protein
MIEQCLWFIGNMTGEASQFKEIIINNTTLPQCFEKLLQYGKINKHMLRTMCWVNSNLARHGQNTPEQIQVWYKVARAGLFTEDP